MRTFYLHGFTQELTLVRSVLEDVNASKAGQDLYIRSIRFSPDSMLLATGAEDRKIRVRYSNFFFLIKLTRNNADRFGTFLPAPSDAF